MKNLLKIGLLAALLVINAAVFANGDDFALKVKGSSEKMITFSIAEGQDVNLTISGSDEEVIYEQKIHEKQAAIKTYNLAAFPDGNYVVKLETETKLSTYQLTIKNGKAIVSEPLVVSLFKPVLTVTEEIISLDLNNPPSGPIELNILNDKNDSIYSGTFATTAKMPTRFNIGQTESNELTFVVRAKNQEYIKTVQIR